MVPDDDNQDPAPKSYDLGLISPTMRDFMLDVMRKYSPALNTAALKKMAVDLLETAQPSDMPPGKLDWERLERKREKFGPHWSLADMLEREK